MCTIGQVPAKLYRIKLSKSERHELEAHRDQKRGKASGIMRAVALLLSDEGPHGSAMKDADIQAQTGISIRNLERLRLRCCEIHARITQLACSKPPVGHARWTLRPLVCLDEFAKQLLSEARNPVAAIPGHLAREDYEYVREGSVSGFMIAMPHFGKT
jgi:hypothetical protein